MTDTDFIDEEPIADLFPHCSGTIVQLQPYLRLFFFNITTNHPLSTTKVFFADISGTHTMVWLVDLVTVVLLLSRTLFHLNVP